MRSPSNGNGASQVGYGAIITGAITVGYGAIITGAQPTARADHIFTSLQDHLLDSVP